MNNYEDQADVHSKFYSNFENIINETIAKEIYSIAVVEIADENDWNGDDWDEYDTELEWYKYNKVELFHQAEEDALEEIIRKVFEDAGINVNRLSADDYMDFEEHVKETFPFLDPESEDYDEDEDF